MEDEKGEAEDMSAKSPCVICAHGSLEPGRTISTLRRGRSTAIVRDVPARICDNCGEEYFDGEVTDRLLKIAEAVFGSGIEIAVRDYDAAAAAA